MSDSPARRERFTINMQTLVPTFLTLLVLIAAYFLARLYGLSEIIRISFVPFPVERDLGSVVVNVALIVASTIGGGIMLTLLPRIVEEHVRRGFAVLASLLGLMLSEAFLRLPLPILNIILFWGWASLIIISLIFVVTGIASPAQTDLSMVLYSSVFGLFLGVNTPTRSLLFILTILLAYDPIFVKIARPHIWIGNQHQHYQAEASSSVEKRISVGIGDMIFYSALASHTVAAYDALVVFSSFALILVGSTVTSILTYERKVAPGLSLPLGLGLIPVFARLILSG